MKMKLVSDSMESVASCSSTASVSSHKQERLDLKTIRAVVISVNQCILKFIANAKTRNSIRVRCTSNLQNQNQHVFEFSDQSVISNLYWGIDSIEAAIATQRPEEKAAHLSKAEQMLQVPALLEEDGVTGGIANSYLVCCSYFYLSVVRKLQEDEWQVALHFLQAVLVSSRLVQTEFADDLYESLFLATCAGAEREEIREVDKEEAIMQMARIYRDWLMYYKVMLYGETHHGQGEGCRDSLSPHKESIYSLHSRSIRLEYSNKPEHENSLHTQWNYGKVHPLDPQGDSIIEDGQKTSIHISELEEYGKLTDDLNPATELHVKNREIQRYSSIKRLQDVLDDSETDSPTSSCSDYSAYDIESEFFVNQVDDDGECSSRTTSISADFPKRLHAPSSTPEPGCKALSFARVSQDSISKEIIQVNNSMVTSRRFTNSINGLLPISEKRDKRSKTLQHSYVQTDHQRSIARRKHSSRGQQRSIELRLHSTKDSKSELLSITEKAISKLFHWEGLGKWDEEYAVEVTTIYQILSKKKGEKCAVLKDMILDQLLIGISASMEDKVIRVSVSILSTIVGANKSAIEDIKKKGLRLSDLAGALKRNVHEAAILFYLMNPSPPEIKTLEILPALLCVVSSPNTCKGRPASLPTPLTASLMIIGVLVSSFDHATNNVHLAEISYPNVLRGLLDVARESNIEELISWASILVKCIQYDGTCRRYISRSAPLAPFSRLLECKMKRARCIALEFFHEVLCIPRSSAIAFLQRLQKEGSTNIMNSLMLCVQQLQPEYQLLAANLLLHLDTLDNLSGKSAFREEAMQVLLKLVTSEQGSTTQNLSAFILSNLGGTYSWAGEPYTVAWLVKKAGLTSPYQRNMIKSIHWLDDCLEDAGTDSWCSKIARSIINIGNPVFHYLERGLKSTTRKVSRDCLIAIAWLGFEIAKSPDSIRYSACEILLSGVEQFLHPGVELDERVLACLCIYNYASGRGMTKLIHFSEGVRESLRRLSNVTWMAEELHKVADYVLPNRTQRISCVHTQILEVGVNSSGAACSLMYYKGFLQGGYSDGSVKVWNIKGQSATLLWDMKEHKKAVTCFSLLESRDCLISGSLDKTIRVWQVIHKTMECVEVIETKEPIRHLSTCGDMIFAITRGQGIKVFDASRKIKDKLTNKKVKCMAVVQGKIYAGCKDSSIQELSTTSNRAQEIKAATKFWHLQRRPINAVVTYKDWLYSASSIVEGSILKEWKRHGTPQIQLKTGKREKVTAMGITEDFIYLNCSSSTNSMQIWLRGTHQKVGRISAGSRITSILTANDIILCGTEAGVIKGWIPL